MAVLSKGQTFATGDQVTALKLNDLVDDATFVAGAVDNASTQLSSGAIIVKDGGVTTAKLNDAAVTTAKINDGAVTTAKILDANVTKAKIENLSDYTVLGNVSGGAAAPAEVSILDEDDMASDSDTAIATQQSIKAYVDNVSVFTKSFESAEQNIPAAGTPITFSHGMSSIPKIAQVVLRCKTAAFNYSLGDEIVIGDYGDAGQMQSLYFNTSTIGWGHMYSGSTILIKNRTTDAFGNASSPNFKVVLKAFA